jgi:hypothetical protein
MAPDLLQKALQADRPCRRADIMDTQLSNLGMALKCFSVVKKVLSDTYGEISENEESRDRKIALAIEQISETYRNLSETGAGPDFQDPVNRFAYVYAYVPVHAHWVSELISWSQDAKDLFKKDKVRIACIGGGPGSDLVGILKYLDERGGEPPSIFCEIADGCELWKHTWADLAFSLDLSVKLSTDYIIQRVGDTDVWSHPVQFEKSDIISMSFFVSEIAHLGEPAWDYVGAVFEKMKPGAVLLFNDNQNAMYYGKVDDIARSKGLEVLLEGKGDRRVYDRNEKSDELSEFSKKFGDRRPKLTGDVAWRVLRKPAIGAGGAVSADS